MPLAVPLVSSSNFDCSQVRVPSARARMENAKMQKQRARAEDIPSVRRAKAISHFKAAISFPARPHVGTGPGLDSFVSDLAIVMREESPRQQRWETTKSFDINAQHLRARHYVVQ